MRFIQEILMNKAIVIPAFAWFVAQIIKVVFVIIKEKRFDYKRFVGSGGMPSSHTAFVVSLATIAGKESGLDSIEFGITVALALIVMYDAAGVRRAAGKQARALNELIFSHLDKMHFDEKLKELIGHTPIEVVMGAILGIVLGIFLT